MDGNRRDLKYLRFLFMGALFPQSPCGWGMQQILFSQEKWGKSEELVDRVSFSHFDFWKKDTLIRNI